MRVLIACSDASVRDAFLDALRRADIGVISVADAAATLELARQQRPDIVLLDDESPGIGGVAGLQKLAAETGRFNLERGYTSARHGAGRWWCPPAPGAEPGAVRVGGAPEGPGAGNL